MSKRIIEKTCTKVCPVVRDLKSRNAELRHDVANRNTEIARLSRQLNEAISNLNDLRISNRILATRVHELESDREQAWTVISKIQNTVTVFQGERCNSRNSKITGGP